jgi:hypothetical protein
MKLRNFLVMIELENGDCKYDAVVAGTTKAAYRKWKKDNAYKKFFRLEDMNGVVYDVRG